MNRSLSFSLILLLFSTGTLAADELFPRPAIRALVDQFRRHPVIVFAETHSAHEEHEFLRQLVADPRFSAVPTDVAVEFGNARFQPLVDRYVVALEDVPRAELRKVWRDTTQFGPESWDAPMYEQFFDHVREVNAGLEPARRIRVLLGDPPIDWEQVHTTDDFMPFSMERDPHFAAVIEREALAKNRRVLVIAGALHAMHQEHRPGEPEPFPTVTGILESAHPGAVFVVAPFSGGIATRSMSVCEVNEQFASWKEPSLAMVAGTWLGRTVALDLQTPQGRVLRRHEDLFDAILYLGHPDTLREAKRVYAYYTEQPEYAEELKRRRRIAFGEPLDPETIEYHKLGHPVEELHPHP